MENNNKKPRKGDSVICRVCGKEFVMWANSYNKDYGPACKDCVNKKKAELKNKSYIEKYGSVENFYAQRSEKMKIHIIERYGSIEEYEKLKNEKRWKTAIERYGSLEEYLKIKNENAKKGFAARSEEDKIETNNKRKDTLIERYGSLEEFEKFKNKRRAEAIIEKYGSLEEFERIRGDKISKSLTEYYSSEENRLSSLEKRKQNCLEKYGVDNPMKRQDVIDKINKSKEEKYGDMETYYRITSEKVLNTKKKKYGGKPTSEKAIETARKLCASEEFKKRRRETCLRKYGTETFLPRRFLYIYEDLHFDSSWELAYYIYLKDNNIEFEYKPSPLEYMNDDGKISKYYPDFLVNGQYIEIKGDHLISENGNLTSFGRENVNKTEFLKSINVKYLLNNDLKPIISYVKNNYGKNFLIDCRRK